MMTDMMEMVVTSHSLVCSLQGPVHKTFRVRKKPFDFFGHILISPRVSANPKCAE